MTCRAPRLDGEERDKARTMRASRSVALRFEDLRLPEGLYDLPRARENRLRSFYVDGRLATISRDGNEPSVSYELRASFVFARSHNPRERLEELVANSRVDLNKRWSPVIDDEGGAKVQSPYYADSVEERYTRVKALPAYDAALERVPAAETATTLYYEPEAEAPSPPRVSAAGEEEGEEGEEEGAEGEEEGAEGVEATVVVLRDATDGTYHLTATFPLYEIPAGEKGKIVRRREKPISPSDAGRVLAPVFAAYTAKLSGALAAVGRVDIGVGLAGGIELAARFRSDQAARSAAERFGEALVSLPPVELGRGKEVRRLYFSVPAGYHLSQ